MRENYELLGVSESATDEEIIQKYNELRAKAKQDMWQDGEAGNEAARLLNKLDAAYSEIMSARKERSQTTTEGAKDAYEEISDLLKADKLSEAQAKLDDFNERNAECIICKRSYSIKRTGRTTVKSSWKSPFKWIPTT